MTVETTINRTGYQGNGATKTFAVPFRFLEPGHLVVVLTTGWLDTPQTLNDHYVVTGAGAAGGGAVVFKAAPPQGTRVTIYRNVPPTQESDWVENDPDPAEVKERAFDKLTMLVQQVLDGLARCFRVKETSTLTDLSVNPIPGQFLVWTKTGLGSSPGGLDVALPPVVPGQYLGWSPAGQLATLPVIFPDTGDDNPKENGGVGDGVADDAPVIQDALDDIEAAGGGKLYLPAGVWRLGAVLECSDVPLAIQGAGKFATVILVDNPDGWLRYTGGAEDGLSMTDFTLVAGRLDASSGIGLNAVWPVAAADKGEHFLARNIRVMPRPGYDGSRAWFSTPIRLVNAGGTTGVDVEFEFTGASGPNIDVVNTAPAKGLRLLGCSAKGSPLLRARGGQNDIRLVGCEGNSDSGVVDVVGANCSGLVVNACDFRAVDAPVFAQGFVGVTITGSVMASHGAASISPAVALTDCRKVTITGNAFGDADAAEGSPHVVLTYVQHFNISGNEFTKFLSSAITLTNAEKGLVSCNTARGGQNLATVANCSDVQVRGNTAFGLSGAMVSMTGTNTGVISRENFPSGAATSVVVSGSVLDISNHPEGNIVLSAPAVVHINEIVGGYDGMTLWITAGSTSASTAVYFDYNPGKLEIYSMQAHPVSPPIWDDSATGGSAANIEFTRRNGIWYETTHGL